ncbi:hypothetical protein GMRT_12943 [Giardia muris]|uniref:Uncharacterized protein n=1 Tax=Giardia muris TaxID=5742 RepID=A0A4Z1ST25_GIAMU|nr:hypothetical protein GMRT_12943 [Giardia muris]|eukprot:TNJ29092.1 hypothetical protein GMRT_12943 [Giardia muris]
MTTVSMFCEVNHTLTPRNGSGQTLDLMVQNIDELRMAYKIPGSTLMPIEAGLLEDEYSYPVQLVETMYIDGTFRVRLPMEAVQLISQKATRATLVLGEDGASIHILLRHRNGICKIPLARRAKRMNDDDDFSKVTIAELLPTRSTTTKSTALMTWAPVITEYHVPDSGLISVVEDCCALRATFAQTILGGESKASPPYYSRISGLGCLKQPLVSFYLGRFWNSTGIVVLSERLINEYCLGQRWSKKELEELANRFLQIQRRYVSEITPQEERDQRAQKAQKTKTTIRDIQSLCLWHNGLEWDTFNYVFPFYMPSFRQLAAYYNVLRTKSIVDLAGQLDCSSQKEGEEPSTYEDIMPFVTHWEACHQQPHASILDRTHTAPDDVEDSGNEFFALPVRPHDWFSQRQHRKHKALRYYAAHTSDDGYVVRRCPRQLGRFEDMKAALQDKKRQAITYGNAYPPSGPDDVSPIPLPVRRRGQATKVKEKAKTRSPSPTPAILAQGSIDIELQRRSSRRESGDVSLMRSIANSSRHSDLPPDPQQMKGEIDAAILSSKLLELSRTRPDTPKGTSVSSPHPVHHLTNKRKYFASLWDRTDSDCNVLTPSREDDHEASEPSIKKSTSQSASSDGPPRQKLNAICTSLFEKSISFVPAQPPRPPEPSVDTMDEEDLGQRRLDSLRIAESEMRAKLQANGNEGALREFERFHGTDMPAEKLSGLIDRLEEELMAYPFSGGFRDLVYSLWLGFDTTYNLVALHNSIQTCAHNTPALLIDVPQDTMKNVIHATGNAIAGRAGIVKKEWHESINSSVICIMNLLTPPTRSRVTQLCQFSTNIQRLLAGRAI